MAGLRAERPRGVFEELGSIWTTSIPRVQPAGQRRFARPFPFQHSVYNDQV